MLQVAVVYSRTANDEAVAGKPSRIGDGEIAYAEVHPGRAGRKRGIDTAVYDDGNVDSANQRSRDRGNRVRALVRQPKLYHRRAAALSRLCTT